MADRGRNVVCRQDAVGCFKPPGRRQGRRPSATLTKTPIAKWWLIHVPSPQPSREAGSTVQAPEHSQCLGSLELDNKRRVHACICVCVHTHTCPGRQGGVENERGQGGRGVEDSMSAS